MFDKIHQIIIISIFFYLAFRFCLLIAEMSANKDKGK